MATSPAPSSTLPARITRAWHALELSQQFLIASAIAILIAMAIVGTWLSRRIEQTITQNSALETALYVESFVGERIQGLADNPTFDAEVQQQLQHLVIETPLGRHITTFKIWIAGGRVIYASRPEHVGRTYAPTDHLKAAWTGEVEYEFDELHDDEDVVERSLAMPLLEVYVPVRRRFGGDVIAVVEFYEDATTMAKDIDRAKLEAWMLLGAIGATVVIALFGMAAGASRTITQQQSALNQRIDELSRLLDQNLLLRQRVEDTSRRAAELNERCLRRLGSDLHDGPAQLISLALFRLDATRRPSTAGAAASGASNVIPPNDKDKIREALTAALKDIREISIGLSMPELDALTLAQAIREAIHAHEHRTETRIAVDMGDLPDDVPAEVKVTGYRLVQEGLNNANRHAPQAKVSVSVSAGDGSVRVRIEDAGPGFDTAAAAASDRLGLAGLGERLEYVGGKLVIDSRPGAGTRLDATLPLPVQRAA